MPRYLLSVFGSTEAGELGSYGSQQEMLDAFADTGRFNDRLQRDGHLVFADGLAPASSATTVDGQGNSPTMTAGPYLEAKEHIGGFWVIDAADLDEALALAAEGSRACRGVVEVRPFQTEADVAAMVDAASAPSGGGVEEPLEGPSDETGVGPSTEPDDGSVPLPRQPFPAAPTEVEALLAALHRNRRTFAWKCFGLSRDDMNRRLGPSALTLAMLVKHTALVEDHYFTHQLHDRAYPEVWAPLQGNENWDMDSAADDTPEQLRELWLAAVARSQAATDEALADGGLDRLVQNPGGGEPYNLRRVIVDAIEEYARHTGHADLIRESIDGRVGENVPR